MQQKERIDKQGFNAQSDFMLTQCLLYFNHVCTKLSVPCRCDNISVVQWSGRNCVYITSLCQGLTANAMNLKTVYNVNIFIKLVAQCLRTLEVRVWHPGSVLISPCTTSLSCHQPLRSGLSELHLINLMTYISLPPPLPQINLFSLPFTCVPRWFTGTAHLNFRWPTDK